jgi:chromosome segregation ATPase
MSHKTRQQLAQTTEQANTAINDLRGRLNQAVDIGMQLSARNKAIQEAGNLATQHGLNDSEHLQAVQLARQAKSDPVGALKSLLTRAHAAGIDLTSLGLQPGGFDTKSLMDMVRAEIANGTAPIRERVNQESQRETQQREAAQAQESVKQELNSFLTQNPAARQWLPAFKEIYSRPELAKMSLGEVWSRLQLNLLQRGIDPNNPQKQQRSPNPPQRRLPNGRGNPPGGGRERAQPLDLAPVSTSYEDIVKGVLGS